MEERVYHEALRYAGTLDIRGTMGGQRAIADIKSGQVPKTVGSQVAAYDEAQRQSKGRPSRRYCVQLMPNSYRLHALMNKGDFNLFVSCLNIAKFQQEKA